jgi:hypothetical protein
LGVPASERRGALREKKDGHLGQRILEAMGVPQKQVQNDANLMVPGQDGQALVAFGIANILLEGNKNFGVNIDNPAIKELIEEAHQEEEAKKKV